MRTLIIPMAPPASGKSTIMKALAESLDNCEYFSRDDIRFSLLKDGEDYFAHEDEVTKLFFEGITHSLYKNEYTIADATHLTPHSRAQLFCNIHCDSTYEVIGVWIECPKRVCIDRNKNRDGLAHVPDKVINNFFKVRKYPSADIDGHWFDRIIKIETDTFSPAENVNYILSIVESYHAESSK